MAKPLVSDELWQRIEPLLPKPKPRRFRFPGRKPLDYRKVLTGIIFVLKTGIPWEELPQEMGCGCGMSCLNYLNAWQRAGVWKKLHEILLAELEEADKLDWSARPSIVPRPAPWGRRSDRPQSHGSRQTRDQAPRPDRWPRRAAGDPQHRGQRAGRQRTAAAGRRHPAGARRGGPPRRLPENLYADRAYDSQPHREELKARGIDPHLARRRTEHGSGLGVYRWVAERTESWLHKFRRLLLRTDREGPVHDAFVSLASALICMWFL